MTTTIKATASDFKVGTTLVDNCNASIEYTLVRKYDDGVWEAINKNGSCVCVYESEARFYNLK